MSRAKRGITAGWTPGAAGIHTATCAIVVMVVGKHREDFFAHEESWLAMRDLFRYLGQRHTDSAHSPQMLAMEIRFEYRMGAPS